MEIALKDLKETHSIIGKEMEKEMDVLKKLRKKYFTQFFGFTEKTVSPPPLHSPASSIPVSSFSQDASCWLWS